MQVSNMSNQYIFESPSSSRVQVGRLDTTVSKEQDTTTKQTEEKATNESKTFADSKEFQETQTKEVQQIENSNSHLDLYA